MIGRTSLLSPDQPPLDLGRSFHFGPRWKGETFMESIKRAEYHLCSRLGMKPGKRALDVGCGVGGPMRNMAIHSGAQIDGITINQYQASQPSPQRGKQPHSELGQRAKASMVHDACLRVGLVWWCR
jgi:hypothetical protein